jgi:hypothetical protein
VHNVWDIFAAGAYAHVFSLHVVSQMHVVPVALLTQAAEIVAEEHVVFVTHPAPVVMQVVKNPEQAELVVKVLGALAQVLSTHAVLFQ